MNWFKPKYTVCAECGVHFESVTGFDGRRGNLCAFHYKPVMERAMRKDAVLAWAANNIERLGKMMDKELAVEEAEYNKQMAAMHNMSMSAAHQAQSGASPGNQYCQNELSNHYSTNNRQG